MSDEPAGRLLAPLEMYLRQIDRTPLLTRAEEVALARRIRAGDGAARDRMIRANLRLVVSLARRYTGRGLSMDDAIAEGNLGLLHAVERFNPDMNVRFSTYAVFWIRQSFKRALVNTSRTIRLPGHVFELARKWQQAAARLRGDLGRDAAAEEVAAALGLTRRKAKLVQQALAAETAGLDSDDGEGHYPFLDPRSVPPDEAFVEQESRNRLRARLAAMDEREASVLRLRFGLDGNGKRTLQQTGAVMGVTKERVRQIESKALGRLVGVS